MPQTRRQRLLDLLSCGPQTVTGLAETLQAGVAQVVDDLTHLRRSQRGKRIVVQPAQCLVCGFQFRKRERFTAPSRCPQCKSELQLLSN